MLWKRVPGRQNTGYFKTKLFSFWFFDCYFLEYPVGSYLPEHKDEVKDKRHFRFNIELTKAKRGGIFICDFCEFKFWRFALFESSRWNHCMLPVKEGKRRVLSFGFVKNY